ncbi:Hypothetical predicted protein [Paramuricea clavata]|uniref:Uncharacterized protein n=1 Tax=Paramuricea clavata TaxID=317549 RepID=A0A6S7K6E2_PARCT|nr:Hypothetical predicted protein [Paramuricea clavata]
MKSVSLGLLIICSCTIAFAKPRPVLEGNSKRMAGDCKPGLWCKRKVAEQRLLPRTLEEILGRREENASLLEGNQMVSQETSFALQDEEESALIPDENPMTSREEEPPHQEKLLRVKRKIPQ